MGNNQNILKFEMQVQPDTCQVPRMKPFTFCSVWAKKFKQLAIEIDMISDAHESIGLPACYPHRSVPTPIPYPLPTYTHTTSVSKRHLTQKPSPFSCCRACEDTDAFALVAREKYPRKDPADTRLRRRLGKNLMPLRSLLFTKLFCTSQRDYPGMFNWIAIGEP